MPAPRLPLALSRRVLPYHLLGVVAVSIAVGLGMWQLEAWQHHRELAAAEVSDRDVVPLGDLLDSGEEFPAADAGAPVEVTGTWQPDLTFYVDGRTRGGEEGYWVLTPVAVGGDGALLPLVRGWTSSLDALPAPPTGSVDIVAWLQPGEGTGASDPDPTDRILPQVRLADVVRLMDAEIYDGYAVIDHERADAAATGDLASVTPDEVPSVGFGTGLRNLLYAIEWWVFAAFAAFVWWRFVRDDVERQRVIAEQTDADAAAGDGDSLGGGVSRPARQTLVRRQYVGAVRGTLLRYRVMASIVGVLLIVLILVGVPLANFDGSSMWGFIPSTPAMVTEGSGAQQFGEAITHYLGVAHGWLYMIFLVTAFLLARKALWEPGFTVITLICGTIPVLSFWAEHRATQRVKREYAAELSATQ